MEKDNDKFHPDQYLKVLSGVLLHPKQYFEDLGEAPPWPKPLIMLMISGIIFSVATVVSGMLESPIVVGTVFIFNAVGMVFITSALGFGIMSLIRMPKVTYRKIFSIYAYSSAAVLVLAWMPFMFWITEIWRWCLIGYGLVKGCGFSVRSVILIIFLSFIILVGLFNYGIPLIMSQP